MCFGYHGRMLSSVLFLSAAMAGEGPDALTALAVGTASYATLAVTHEVLGHGLGCAAAGGQPLGFSTTYMVCDTAGMGPADIRLGTFAGTGANLLVGASMAGALALQRPQDGWSQHYLWTTATTSLFLSGSYMATGAIFDTGDFGEYLSTIPPERRDRARLAIAAAGVGTVALTFPISIMLADRMLGSDPGKRRARGRTLGWVPYAGVGLGLMTATGALNKELGPGQGSAASLVGYGLGTLYLAYMPLMFGQGTADGAGPPLKRSAPWLAVGAASLVSMAALGRGVGALDPEPLDHWHTSL